MLLARIVLSFAQYPKYRGEFVAQWAVVIRQIVIFKSLVNLNKFKKQIIQEKEKRFHAISKVVYCTLLGNL